MAIVAGFDVHRQITFDALDTEIGEVSRGRVDVTSAAVAGWTARFSSQQIEVAVEACTGWLFVCDALVAAGAVALGRAGGDACVARSQAARED
jgi:transposase